MFGGNLVSRGRQTNANDAHETGGVFCAALGRQNKIVILFSIAEVYSMNGKKVLPMTCLTSHTDSSYAKIAYYHSYDVRSVIISNARFVAALVCSEQPCHMGKCTDNPIHGFECECDRMHMGRRCEIGEYA